MSGARMILTYKRKRLPPCPSLRRGTVFQDLPCEASSDKHDDSIEVPIIKTQRRDPVNLICVTCGGGENLQACESCHQPYHLHCLEHHLKAHKSNMKDAVNCINGPHMRQIETDSHQFHPTKVCSETASELTTENVSSGVPLQKCTNSIQEVFCSSVDAGPAINDGHIEDGSVYQSVQKHSDTPVDNSGFLSGENVETTRMTAPLITFSRRSRGKEDAARTDVFNSLLKKVELEAANKGKAVCLPAASCEASSQRGSSTNQPEIHGLDTIERRESGEKVTSKGYNCSSLTPARSYSETESVRPLETSTDNVVRIPTSPADDPASEKASVWNISAPKDCLGWSSHKALADSSTKDASSSKLPILSGYQDLIRGESELDSSGRTDSNVATGKIAELKCSQASLNSTFPRPDSCKIDCNVIPELDIQKQTAVAAAEAPPESALTAKNDAGILREVSTRGEVLELFGTSGDKNKELQLSHHTQLAKCTDLFVPVTANGRDHEHARHMLDMNLSSQSKCLQLFAEGRKNSMLPSTRGSQTLNAISGAEQRSTFSQGSEKNNIGNSSVKTSMFLNLSLPVEGGTSSQIPCARSSPNLNIRSGEYSQNTVAQSLPDMRRNTLRLKSDSSALGMSSNYLEKFEANRNLWSDDELDFLWIGVRRYGRGHWDAMKQDPRLCFAPWRTARDLADRWEFEQYKLLNGYSMPQSTYARPQDAYFDNKGRFVPPRAGDHREMVSAEPRLSLGDLYAQKEGGYFTSNIQNYQFKQPMWAVRSTNWLSNSSSQVGSHASDLFSSDGRVMRRSENNGPMTGLSARDHLPHWLREAATLPTLRPAQPAPPVGPPLLSHTETLKLVQSLGAPPEPSGMMRNTRAGGVLVTGDPQPSSSVTPAGAFARRLGATELRGAYSRPSNRPDNLVVVESDRSSEETVSDDARL